MRFSTATAIPCAGSDNSSTNEANETAAVSTSLLFLYNLINSQGAALRFTEPDDSMRPHNYEQAELFDTGDLDAVAPATEAVQTQDEAAAKTTVFDADYDSLSRRIESGELSMFQDDYDEGQVKLGLADTRQIDMPAGNGDISAADAKLRIAFGLIDKEDEKVPEEVKQFDEQDIYDAVRVRKKKSRKKREAHGAAPEYEYTSPEQDDEVVSMLEKSIRKNRIKLLLSVVIAVAVLSESIMIKFAVFTSLSCIVGDSQYSVYHVSLLNNTDIRSVLSCQSF